jgi:ankyrin repeat protein
LKAGADVNAQESGGLGLTALMMSVWDGHLDAVKTLLTAGADLTRKNKEGRTALDIAKLSQAPRIAAVLETAAIQGGSK